jgi:hypothetical protein
VREKGEAGYSSSTSDRGLNAGAMGELADPSDSKSDSARSASSSLAGPIPAEVS